MRLLVSISIIGSLLSLCSCGKGSEKAYSSIQASLLQDGGPTEQAQPASALLDSLGVVGLVNRANYSIALKDTSWAKSADLMKQLGVSRVRLDAPPIARGGESYSQAEFLLRKNYRLLLTTSLKMDLSSQQNQSVEQSSYACRKTFDGSGNLTDWTGSCYTSAISDAAVQTPFGAYTYTGLPNLLAAFEQDCPGCANRICFEGPNEWANSTHNTALDMNLTLRDQALVLVNGLQGGNPSQSIRCLVAPVRDANIYAGQLDPNTGALALNGDGTVKSVTYPLLWNPAAYEPSYRFMKVEDSGSPNFANVHCYQSPDYFDDTVPDPQVGDDPNDNYAKVKNCRFGIQSWALDRVIDRSKIVVSEFGISSCNQLGSGGRGCFTEAEQASYLPLRWIQMYGQGHRQMFSYNFMEADSSSSFENNFGLIKSDFTPKPVFYSLKRLTSHFAENQKSSLAGKLQVKVLTPESDFAHLTFQRSDGVFVMVFYRKPSSLVSLSQAKSISISFGFPHRVSQFSLSQDLPLKVGATTQAFDFYLKDIAIVEIN